MKIRIVCQVKVFKLLLNDMTSAKIEYMDLAAFSDDKERLLNWYQQQFAPEPYHEKHYFTGCLYYKTFKKNSLLEWFNPMHESLKQGIHEEWVDRKIFKEIKHRHNFI